jgi:hypothetical protein
VRVDVVTISIALGFAAGAVQLVGYWVYNKEANGRINTGSWSIWALAGIIDLASYSALTGDWVVNILPSVCAVAAIGTFCLAVARKRFNFPDKMDLVFVGVDGMITVVWYFTNTAFANLLYQASTILSFIPMYRGQLSGRENEEPLPWVIWTFAYSLLAVSVALRLHRWEELAYPLTNVVVDAVVVLITLAKQRSSR